MILMNPAGPAFGKQGTVKHVEKVKHVENDHLPSSTEKKGLCIIQYLEHSRYKMLLSIFWVEGFHRSKGLRGKICRACYSRKKAELSKSHKFSRPH